jgi:hypothetical protein
LALCFGIGVAHAEADHEKIACRSTGGKSVRALWAVTITPFWCAKIGGQVPEAALTGPNLTSFLSQVSGRCCGFGGFRQK